MNEVQKLRILLDPSIPDKDALIMCEEMDKAMIEVTPVDSPYFEDDWTDERPYHD